jgi:hypothetical protein
LTCLYNRVKDGANAYTIERKSNIPHQEYGRLREFLDELSSLNLITKYEQETGGDKTRIFYKITQDGKDTVDSYCKSYIPLIFGSVKDLLKEEENLFAPPPTVTVKVTYTISGFNNTVVTFDLSGKDIESIRKELPQKKKELDSNFNVDPYRSNISIDRDAYK